MAVPYINNGFATCFECSSGEPVIDGFNCVCAGTGGRCRYGYGGRNVLLAPLPPIDFSPARPARLAWHSVYAQGESGTDADRFDFEDDFFWNDNEDALGSFDDPDDSSSEDFEEYAPENAPGGVNNPL